jgi:GxxExxY protein
LTRESRESTRIKVTEIIYKQESYRIVGACFEVYNDEGCGFLEQVYQECLGIEFAHQRIPATISGHYPKLEYERIAKTQHIKPKTDLCDLSL